jgi:hypothetical protein
MLAASKHRLANTDNDKMSLHILRPFLRPFPARPKTTVLNESPGESRRKRRQRRCCDYPRTHYRGPSAHSLTHRGVSQYAWTPLIHAAKRGHLAVVEVLLAKGVDTESKSYVRPLPQTVQPGGAAPSRCARAGRRGRPERALAHRAAADLRRDAAAAALPTNFPQTASAATRDSLSGRELCCAVSLERAWSPCPRTGRGLALSDVLLRSLPHGVVHAPLYVGDVKD